MNTEKDYSLLRPFDLEAAKAGHEITNENGDARIYVDGPDYMGQVCVKGCQGGLYIDPVGSLFMSPLCWVEGKPVYKGDVLYSKITSFRYEADGSENDEFFTWTKPTVKRDGWVNVYQQSSLIGSRRSTGSEIYESKADADLGAGRDRIDCVRIEWEEPAGGAA